MPLRDCVREGEYMLLLKNATLLQFAPPEVQGGMDILIDGDRITEVGGGIAPGNADVEIMDLGGDLISPGIVCSHNHFYSALARGITADIKPSTDFVSILHNLWWRLDRAIDEEILLYSGLVAAIEAVRAGTTAVIDHHASPSFIRGSLGVLKEAFEKVGLRGILCYEVTDRNGSRGMRDGVDENIAFAKNMEKERKSTDCRNLLEASIGAHASFTLGNEALVLLAEAVHETDRGLHIHTAEDRYDTAVSHHLYGMDIMQRLESKDVLNEKTICVHGVYLTNSDIERLNAHDCFLIHNARSNMNNTIGYAEKLPSLRNVALGTDGLGSDMFEEMKFAYFKHRDAGGAYWPTDFLGFLHNGNLLLGRYFPMDFGKIERGFAADLVIYDYKNPTPIVGNNIAGHMAFGLSSRDVKSVIIGGVPVYTEREFPFEVEPIYEKAAHAAQRLWDRMDEMD
jgi:putative selenium metabolism protein SsnA